MLWLYRVTFLYSPSASNKQKDGMSSLISPGGFAIKLLNQLHVNRGETFRSEGCRQKRKATHVVLDVAVTTKPG